jgi:hypothetical protein
MASLREFLTKEGHSLSNEAKVGEKKSAKQECKEYNSKSFTPDPLLLKKLTGKKLSKEEKKRIESDKLHKAYLKRQAALPKSELKAGWYLVRGGYFEHYDDQNGYDHWQNFNTQKDDGITWPYVTSKIGEVKPEDWVDYESLPKDENGRVIQPEGYNYEKIKWGKFYGNITFVS